MSPCTFYIRFPKCHFLHHFAGNWRADIQDIGEGALELPVNSQWTGSLRNYLLTRVWTN